MGTNGLRKYLRKLNNAQSGSLAEHIYEHYATEKGLAVSSVHNGEVDYVVNAAKIDVKSKRLLDQGSMPETLSPKSSSKEIQYHHVLFLKESVIICDGKREMLHEYGYDSVIPFFKEWTEGHRVSTRQYHRRRLPRALEDRIRDCFKRQGKGVRIIYRTIVDRWGKDAPHNLKPRRADVNSVTVYMAFRAHELDPDDLKYIIAFPDADYAKFPLMKSPRMAKEKVDASKLADKYRFGSVEELLSEFSKRFSEK